MCRSDNLSSWLGGSSGAASEREAITCRFMLSAHDQKRRRESRRIPHLSIEGRKSTKLLRGIGSRLEKQHLAILRGRQQEIAGKQELPVPDALALPARFTVRQVDAGDAAIIESVDEPFVKNQAGKF